MDDSLCTHCGSSEFKDSSLCLVHLIDIAIVFHAHVEGAASFCFCFAPSLRWVDNSHAHCRRGVGSQDYKFSSTEARQWDMFPEPTELLLIGFRSNQFGPKNPSYTHGPKNPIRRFVNQGKFHTRWMDIIFSVCSTLAVSVLQFVLKWCRKERTKIQVEKESQQNRSRQMNFVSRYSAKDL